MDLRFVFIVILLKWTYAQGKTMFQVYVCLCVFVCVCVWLVCVCLGILFVQQQLLKCSFSHLFKCCCNCKYAIENASYEYLLYTHTQLYVCACVWHSNEVHLAEVTDRLASKCVRVCGKSFCNRKRNF